MKFLEFLAEEQKEKHAVLAFGRINPPTTGHQKLVNKVKEVAKSVGGSHHVVLSHSQDKSKNPLTSQQKLKHAKRFFPNTNLSVATKEEPNFLAHAKKLHQSGVTHLHMVAGSDRVPEYKKLLHKYNGTHEGALFNFKDIHVHSAGERDPNAKGTEGMSASKMRSHASAGEYEHFKKGIPSHVPEHHAKELYHDVRKGMNIKESLDERFEYLLSEGVHDKSIFKAVFLGGGPGSGKDFVLSKTLDGQGLTEVNSDKALEFLMDKNNLDMKMPESEREARDLVRSKAKNVTELKQKLAMIGRNGLIINGTGDDVEKISKIKKRLEDLGYETSMIMVNTDDKVSSDRNIERGQRGGRTVPEKIRKEKWDSVQNARPELAKLFGDNYNEVDNSEDLRNAPPEVRQAKEQEFLGLFKNIQKFISKPPKNDVSKQWIASELQKKDTLPIPKGETSVKPHPGSKAAEEAQRLGLTYFGFGRYGKNGKVTHRSIHDKLTQVEKQKVNSVNESFETYFNDAITEEKYEVRKHITDKDGKIRIFTLRTSAATVAHQKNGTVYPHKKGGYIVKMNEENENVSISEKTLFEGRRDYSTSGARSCRETIEEQEASLTTAQEYSRAEGITDEAPWTPGKISISGFRKKTKEVKESIDKGIESGLSMAGAGESVARDMGEKYRKPKDGKVSVTETIGDGGEAATSISDKKEDELKKQGISLQTFKAKRPI